jgi:multidrug efflux pump subunit AcrB
MPFKVISPFGSWLPTPAVSDLAALAGIAAGQVLRLYPCAQASGSLWAIGAVLLLAASVALPARRAGAWVVLALVGYAPLVLVFQPSLRSDGDAAAAVRASALSLRPAVAGGVALSRTGRQGPACCPGRWSGSGVSWTGTFLISVVQPGSHAMIPPALVVLTIRALLAALGDSPGADLPAITLEAVYPGANAQVVADTVAAPIEEQVKGVLDMQSMASRCTNDGSYTLTVTFKPGSDLNIHQVLVQNRVALALPTLPDLVKRGGVTVRKGTAGPLLLVILFSPDASRSTLYLGNYSRAQLKDELARLAGVGDISLLGQHDSSMRLWLDPDKLTAYKLTAADVLKALEELKLQAAPGSKDKGPFTLTLPHLGALSRPEEVGNIIVKTHPGGGLVYVKDVARVEVGGTSRESHARFDDRPAVVLAVAPTREARRLKLSAALRDRLAELHGRYPAGVDHVVLDFTPNLEAPGRPTTPEYLVVDLTLPDSASLERTVAVLDRCAAILKKQQGVQHVLALSDHPFDRVASRPCLLVCLAPAGKERPAREKIMQAIRGRLEQVREAAVRLRDLSGASRFPRCGYPIDLAVHGPERERVQEFGTMLAERLGRGRQLTDVWASRESLPLQQLYVDIDRAKCKAMGVPLQDVFDALQTYLGSYYVNDFNRFGRTWQVSIGGGGAAKGDDLKRLKVRNDKDDMVPFSAFATIRTVSAPVVVDRLDGEPMVGITANPAPGVSLAEARAFCEARAEEVRKELRLPAAYRLALLQAPSAAR